MAEAFVGQIGIFGFNFAPQDWAFCSGTTLLVGQYQALYAVIGNNFGGTAGQTFKIPDLTGGYGLSGIGNGGAGYEGIYGQKVGSLQTTVTINDLPQHSHAVNVVAAVANNAATLLPVGNMLAEGYYSSGPSAQRPRNVYTAYNQSTAVPMAAATITPFGGPGAATVTNQQPFLAMNFCICANGYFPIRP